MAITLNLKHTFTTRVVYSTELITESRALIASQYGEAQKKLEQQGITNRARLNAVNVIRLAEVALSKSDEDMILFTTAESFKKGLQSELSSSLAELQVVRMSPVQTQVVS
ncbi:hypothetical protein [Pseudomonas sp. PSPC3-3]|uniref:hypothetical protein n=1 Tax=unclassified Pseudomonas TaxID=196821 RepID=UPI003CE72F87